MMDKTDLQEEESSKKLKTTNDNNNNSHNKYNPIRHFIFNKSTEFKTGIIILLIIIIIIIVLKIKNKFKKKNSNTHNDNNVTNNNNTPSNDNKTWIGNSKHQEDMSDYPSVPGAVYEHHITTIIRTAAQLNAQTRQSKNLLLKLISATNALSYVNVLERIANTQTIENIGSINFDEFKEELENEQLSIIQRISKKYPNLQPDSLYTISTGWST